MVLAPLDVWNCAVGLGGFWSACVFLLAIAGGRTNLGGRLIELIAKVYIGYGPTLPRGLIGGLWGWCDGFFSGWVAAWLYNKLLF